LMLHIRDAGKRQASATSFLGFSVQVFTEEKQNVGFSR
jgi:hypothetical protein